MSSLPLPIAAFFAGLISFLSPCVLPLVPGYVSLISGAGVEELQRQDAKLRRSVMLNSLTFGAIASQIGRFVGHHLHLFSKVAGVIIVVFGLHLTGLLPIRALYADKRLHGLSNGGSAARSFLMGFAFAFGWAPCAGPILAV